MIDHGKKPREIENWSVGNKNYYIYFVSFKN